MNSSLYECRVMHARFFPRAHRFAYRIFLFAFDLDELESLHRKLRVFSLGRRNLYSFRSDDYLPTHEPMHPPGSAAASRQNLAPTALKSRVVGFLAQHGISLSDGKVTLVTLPRVFGYKFNPVSFYFCSDVNGQPVATIAEVTNTFGEMKPYLLGPEYLRSDGSFARRTPKNFYVSPYSDVDVAFDFNLRPLNAALSVQIDDYVGLDRSLTSTLLGKRRGLSDGRLLWFTVKYPLITVKIISLIHWHALLLWIKRVPWFAKSARPEHQRDLYRPHASLQGHAAPHVPQPNVKNNVPAAATAV